VSAAVPAKVLVVDDMEDDLYMTRRFLGAPRGMKCEFIEAMDGKAGLEATAASGTIDLVLLDINMPVMNGFEMLQKMREHPDMRDIPVVMYTGSTYDKDKERAALLGAQGYLEKPAQFPALSTIISTLPTVHLVREEGQVPTLVRASDEKKR
jgi:CheY-like chemotaxis protein